MTKCEMRRTLTLLLLFCCLQLAFSQSVSQEHKWLKRLEGRTIVKNKAGFQVDQRQPLRVARKQQEQGGDLPKRVEPLLAGINRWHQYDAPYWNLTPIVEDRHCPAGCVALAQAQVMHFWRHPDQGKGEFSYNDSLGCGQLLSAKFYEHTYEWDKMLYEYEDSAYTDEEVYPMALLLSDCGISVQTKYNRSASGAQPVMHSVALTRYFGYDPAVQLHFRDFYTEQEIITLLKQELAAGRPLLVSGYNYRIGHAFVIDGYNEDDWFHVMLGNPKGNGDGWTSLECMNGSHEEYDYTLSPESGFNLMQVFTVGIQPETSTSTPYHVFAMEGMSVVSATGNEARIRVGDLSNIGYNIHHDSVSIMLLQADSIVRPLYTYQREFLLEEIDDTAYTDTLSILLSPDIPDGQYRLMPMFKDNGTWQPVRCCVGTPNYLLCDLQDGLATFSSDTAHTAFLTLEDFDVPDLIISGSAPDISLRLKNHQAESVGRIYFFMEPTVEGQESFFLYKMGYAMEADEVRTYRFCTTNIYPPKTGQYRLRILYDNNLFSQHLTELTDEDTPILVSVLHGNIMQIASNVKSEK